jgi:recombination protein RecR
MSAVLPRAVERLIEAFARLPGIGPKTASRLTYFLLRAPEGESLELAEALQAMRAGTVLCSVCFNITDRAQDPCAVCRDPARSAGVLCVVEAPLDVLALERTESFRGRYHVLHGAISPVEGVGPEDLRIVELIARVAGGGIEEIILATNPTLEGEATAMYLRKRLESFPLRVTRLARGLPAGGDLEYADASTLSQALEGRREIP